MTCTGSAAKLDAASPGIGGAAAMAGSTFLNTEGAAMSGGKGTQTRGDLRHGVRPGPRPEPLEAIAHHPGDMGAIRVAPQQALDEEIWPAGRDHPAGHVVGQDVRP